VLLNEAMLDQQEALQRDCFILGKVRELQPY
jgi:hypothetical protein